MNFMMKYQIMRRILITGTLLLTISGWINGKPANNDLKLWYTKPAEIWLEALPIGNGSLGGMIYGGVDREHIQFNEETLITGTSQTVGNYQLLETFILISPDYKL